MLGTKHIRHLRPLTKRSRLLRELPAHGVVAEVGVDNGDFSRKILEITKPRQLHLIDLWGSDRYDRDKERRVRDRFSCEIASDRVVIRKGDSIEQLASCEDAYFDWVYIDTTHKYERTLRELELSRSKVKARGIIAGHDFCKGRTPSGEEYGVITAVHEFCEANNWEMIYITMEASGRGSYALRELRPV